MQNSTSKPVEACQICGHKNLDSILFIGYLPPVNTMPAIGSVPVEERAYPLELLRCEKCTLVQIGLEVRADVLFPPEYPYLSASTRILRDNFADLYKESNELLKLKADDLIVDIGSNDGTLLGNFHKGGHRVLGVEPSQAGEIANKNGVKTKIAFFGKKIAAEVKKEMGAATVITAANVFAHIGDVHAVVDGIVDLLKDDGVFISESHYLLGLIETVQYDTVYHEHLRYYSLMSLKHLLESHGLEIFRVKKIPTHGGSIRVYADRKGKRPIDNSVTKMLMEEKEAGLTSGKVFERFRQRSIQSKLDLMKLLSQLKKEGAKIYGVGAPSRASTLIKYIGLDDGILDCVVEIKGSHKIGKYMPGTRIPVVEESVLFQKQPEYALFLSWHIANELAENLKKNGYKGKFITPLPEPRIL
ncbi:MAG: methyltransferase family protein [Bacteriovoracaceae bacterium]|nr:methyltransferase family protein [Bacteriovoracaceae bacterium]